MECCIIVSEFVFNYFSNKLTHKENTIHYLIIDKDNNELNSDDYIIYINNPDDIDINNLELLDKKEDEREKNIINFKSNSFNKEYNNPKEDNNSNNKGKKI